MIARRRCAPVGISIAEFERNVAREEAKLARIRELSTSYGIAWGTLALHANKNGRAFVRGAA